MTVDPDRLVRVFDGDGLEPLSLPVTSIDLVDDLHFSPNGRWLVIGRAQAIQVLRTGSWQPAAGLAPMRSGAARRYACFTPDGRWLVGVWEGEFRLLRVDGWRPAPPLRFQGAPDPDFDVDVNSVRVSPDSRWVAAQETSSARQLTRIAARNPVRAPRWRIWSLSGGEELTGPSGEELQRSAAFWPGIAAATDRDTRANNDRWDATVDGSLVRLWPRRAADKIDASCRRLPRVPRRPTLYASVSRADRFNPLKASRIRGRTSNEGGLQPNSDADRARVLGWPSCRRATDQPPAAASSHRRRARPDLSKHAVNSNTMPCWFNRSASRVTAARWPVWIGRKSMIRLCCEHLKREVE
jgi:hypothetical protein